MKSRITAYAVGVTLGLAVATATSAAEIKIGVIGPLSGPAAQSGISIRQGYEVAANEINKNGGIKVDGEQKTIKLLFEDSASRPEVGASAAQKLLGRDNVDILIGDSIASSVTMAVMDVVPSFGKFAMSGEPISIDIAKKIQADPKRFANFWKGDFNSDAYADAVFESVKETINEGNFKPAQKKIAFVVEDTDYGKSNAEYMSKLFEKDGWTVSSNEVVALGYADFYPQIAKLRANEPDLIVSVFTAVNSGIALVKQIQEQDLKSLHMAVYYPIRPEFLAGVGSAADGLLWIPLSFDPVNNKEHKAFGEEFKKLTKMEANGDHTQGYCQMKMLTDNIKVAGTVEPTKLSEAFAKSDTKCVVGRFVYDTVLHTPRIGADYLPVPVAQIQSGTSFAIWPSTVATAKYKPVH